MSDLIERSEVLKQLHLNHKDVIYIDKNECAKRIMAIPSVRPQGEWIVYEGGWKDFDYYPPKCKCNQCGYEEELYILNAKPTKFCPNCGAKMKGADDDYERAVEQMEHDMLYEPTYNSEDGSM